MAYPETMEQASQQDSFFSSTDWAEYRRIFFYNIWVILGVTAVIAIGGLVYFSNLPDLYQTTVQIYVERIGNPAPKSSQDVFLPVTGDEEYYGTQITILTGRRIREEVEKKLGALPAYELDARRLPRTRIVALSITTHDPQWVARIANAFAEIYVKESNTEQLFLTQQVLDFIPEDVDAKDMELMKDTGALEELKNQKFDKRGYAESLAAISEDPVIISLRNQKLQLNSQLVELSQRYKANHPAIVDINNQVAYLDEELKQRTKRILTNIRAALAGEYRINNTRILEEARPPARPSSPNRPLGVGLISLAGFFFATGLVFFIEYANQKIRTERDFRHLSLPFLGYIPLIQEIARGGKGHHKKISEFSLTDILKKNSMLSDAIANVRTHILFSMPYEKSKRIMLTSCIPDEGKTTVSILLALSLTGLNRKIILIDADMRRPYMHNYLRLPNKKGLSDYLTGQAEFDEVIQNVEGSTLKMIAAGTETPNPSELVASDRLRDLLDRCGELFDRVVIDVPPVLFIPDGLIVAKHVHTGVLICGSGMVHKKTAESVREKFAAIGHSFIGIVINKVDLKQSEYNQYYYRYRRYYATTRAGKEAV